MISLKEALISKNRGDIGSRIDSQLKIEELFEFIDKHYVIKINNRNIDDYRKYFKIHDNIIDIDEPNIELIFSYFKFKNNGSASPGRLLPEGFKFGKVEGDFEINSGLKPMTLNGCPEYVGGYFLIYGYGINSLEGCPKRVGKTFTIHDCSITSLKGAPEEVESLIIDGPLHISSLKGMPKVKNKIFLNIRDSLKTLEGCPDRCESFDIVAEKNSISDLTGMPKEVSDFIILSGHMKSLKGMPEDFKGILDIRNAKHINSLKFCPKSVSKVYCGKYQFLDREDVAVSKIKLK